MFETEPLVKESPEKGTKHYGEDVEPRRWWVLLTYFLYGALSNMVSLSFNCTGGPSMQYLNINESELLFLFEIALICVILFSHFGAWYAHKKFKETLLFFALISAVATWIRVFTGPNYGWILITQILVCIGSAPVYGLAMLLAERWFPVRERFIAMSIAVFANNAGWGLAYIIPPLAVGDDVSRIPNYVFFQAIFMSLPVIMGLFFITERPKMPPSQSALVNLIDPNSFWEEMKTLFNKPKFWPLILVFGVIMANSFSTPQVSGVATRRLEFSNLQQSILGSCYVGIGIIAGLLAAIWLATKKSLDYDPIIKFLVTVSFITLIVTEILLNVFQHSSFALVMVCHTIIGIGLIGVTPFVYDSMTESTFPVQESISGNALFVVTCFCTMIINRLSILPILETNGFLMLAVFILPCWIYVMFYFRTDKKREKVDTLHPEIDGQTRQSITLLEHNEKISFNDYNDIVASLEKID